MTFTSSKIFRNQYEILYLTNVDLYLKNTISNSVYIPSKDYLFL